MPHTGPSYLLLHSALRVTHSAKDLNAVCCYRGIVDHDETGSDQSEVLHDADLEIGATILALSVPRAEQ